MQAEANIMHEAGSWVWKSRTQYTVYRAGMTVSKADSSYPLTADGLSIAIARANYLSRRNDNASL